MDRRNRRLHELLAEYGPLLRRAIASVCPRGLPIDLDDIEQEVRLKLWHLLDRESDVVHPKSYLYRIAVNATLDAVKQAKRRREDSLAEPAVRSEAEATDSAEASVRSDGSPETLARRRQVIEAAERCLARLNPNRRLAVRLYLQGLSSQEAADLNGWSEAKARNLIYRGLAELRSLMQKEGLDYEAGA